MVALIKFLQVLLSLSLLIVLHEGGHFLFAKLFKTRVEKFYLFFDYKFHLFSTYDNWFRRLIGKKPVAKKADGDYEYEGTEYGIGWIPLGGYVKIAGMIDESMDKEQMKQPPKPWELRTKPAWQRLLVMLGGVIVNFLVAFFIYAMVLYHWGQEYVRPEDATYGLKFSQQAKADGFQDGDMITGVDDKAFDSFAPASLRDVANGKTVHILRNGQPTDITIGRKLNLLEMLEDPRYADYRLPLAVDSVIPGTAAQQIGLRKGSVITAINTDTIADFNDLTFVLAQLRAKLTADMTHADSVRLRTVAIAHDGRTDTVDLGPQCVIGFTNKMLEYKTTTRTYGFWESMPAGVKYGWDILKGYVNDLKYIFSKKGATQVGGFIAIGNIFPAQWDWQRFWMLTAFLSIILGFMNVLPIPALDGGHALFAFYEMVTGRKPSDKFLERAQYVGIFLLLALLIFANMNDILRLFGLI